MRLGLIQPQKLAQEVRVVSHLYILTWLFEVRLEFFPTFWIFMLDFNYEILSEIVCFYLFVRNILWLEFSVILLRWYYCRNGDMQAHTARMLRTEVIKKEQNSKKIIVVQGNLMRPLHPHCSWFFLHYLITTAQHTAARLLGKFTIAFPHLHSDFFIWSQWI